MKRTFFLYAFLLFIPVSVLSFLAFRLAAAEKKKALLTLSERSGREAERASAKLETALREVFRKGKELIEKKVRKEGDLKGPLVAFLGEDGEITYTLESAERPDPYRRASETEEFRYFRLSRKGGENFEFALGDPEGAIDAYSFYLPRISSQGLRAELLWRIARAALKGGGRRLGEEILFKLLNGPEDLFLEDGLPASLLAAERLLEIDPGLREEICASSREILYRIGMRLPQAALKHFVQLFASGDGRLVRLVSEREKLRKALPRHKSRLLEDGAALEGEFLLVGTRLSPSVLAVAALPFKWPDFDLGFGFEGKITSVSEGKPPALPGRAVHALRLRPEGAPLSFLTVRDLGYEEERERIEKLWLLGCLLLLMTVTATCSGGFALIHLLLKERRLSLLRSQLVANVSHELKSPVTSIRLFSEMLSENHLGPDKVKRFGRLLQGEALRLSQLVENLLDFSRLGRKDVELDLEPVDAASVLQRVAEGFAYRAREKGVEFKAEIPPPADRSGRGGLLLFSNGHAIERITLNLLDNALKYGKAERAEIRLKATMNEEKLEISVTDNGPGISGGELERIFEEFYRLRYEDYSVRGTGLGLALSRRLARKLGGDIRVESDVGRGSTFSLVIPAKQRTEER